MNLGPLETLNFSLTDAQKNVILVKMLMLMSVLSGHSINGLGLNLKI